MLTDLSLELEAGIVGLVGVNGSGKTTLMRLLATRLAPTAGSLRLCGRDPRADLRQVRRCIGYQPQELSMPDSLRVADFLCYMAWLRGIPRRDRASASRQAAELVGLDERLPSRLGTLSGGMRRRVLLAQALLGDPGLLLLDEPAAGLDPEQRVRVRDLLRRTASPGRLVLVSSHLIDDLVGMADRMLMLDAGRLVFDGSVAELERTGSRLIASDSGLSPYEAAFLSLRRQAIGP